MKKMLLLGSFLLAIGNVNSMTPYSNEVYNQDTNQYVVVPGSWAESCYNSLNVTYIAGGYFHSKCSTGNYEYANTEVPYVRGESYSNCQGFLRKGECPNKKN